jgi:hypothetical protein
LFLSACHQLHYLAAVPGNKYFIRFRIATSRLLVVLLALLILNGSVDPADPVSAVYWNGDDYVEDVTDNDIESLYELVTEQVLDLDDFVPEHDNDAGDTDKNMKAAYDWLHLSYYPDAPKLVVNLASPVYPIYTPSFFEVFLSKDCPPPDGYC